MSKSALAIIGFVSMMVVGSVAAPPVAVSILDGSPVHPDPSDVKETFRWPAEIPVPEGNEITPERVALGKALFFEPRISGSGLVSCATCHNPSLDWEDGMARAVGHAMDTLVRHTPTILNLAWAPALFWDGRAYSLEEQALAPIQAAGEMNMRLEDMVGALERIPAYGGLFEAAYPGEGITPEVVAKAIATFERTVVSSEAPFDRWVAGDEAAISDEAKFGFELFTGKARCATCHAGPRFTDDSFHDIGIPGDDIGRGAVIPLPSMQHAFKTPTLRNVDRRAPYMHDGSEATLEEVVELYDVGGRVQRESLSPEIVPLHLSDEEKQALVTFMRTLTSHDPPTEMPVLPPNNPTRR